MKKVKLIISMMVICTWSYGQQHTETVRQEIVFEQPPADNVFYLANINGDVTTEAYNGDKVLLEARVSLEAESPEQLKQAQSDIGIGRMDLQDTVIIYVKNPCNPFGKRKDNWKGKTKTEWGYSWEQNCKQRDSYSYTIHFTLKVPAQINLYVSTINNGDVSVKGVRGNLALYNVNGSIAMEEGAGITTAYTINGDVDMIYSQTPGGSSRYYTLNGDINAWYPQNFGADISFKSRNGDLYTDIKELEYQPMMIEKSSASENGIAFRVEARSSIKIRNGGVQLDFETFNGNVYIREQ